MAGLFVTLLLLVFVVFPAIAAVWNGIVTFPRKLKECLTYNGRIF